MGRIGNTPPASKATTPFGILQNLALARLETTSQEGFNAIVAAIAKAERDNAKWAGARHADVAAWLAKQFNSAPEMGEWMTKCELGKTAPTDEKTGETVADYEHKVELRKATTLDRLKGAGKEILDVIANGIIEAEWEEAMGDTAGFVLTVLQFGYDGGGWSKAGPEKIAEWLVERFDTQRDIDQWIGQCIEDARRKVGRIKPGLSPAAQYEEDSCGR